MINVTLTLFNFMPYPFLSSLVLKSWLVLSFLFQCFNSVLESSFDSQVTKGKEVSMEPLAQGLQEDLVSFLFH